MDIHPYRTAWRTHDLEQWADALAPDVVMHSPVLKTPFRGKEAAIELFGVLFQTLGEIDITDEFVDGDRHVFFWRADIGTKTIEGVDLIRSDEHGKISEIKVLIRPLVDIATFASAIGPSLAAKQGMFRGWLVRVMNLPLRTLFNLLDVVASRLTQRR